MAAHVAAQDAKALGERLHLGVPHRLVGAQRTGEHEDGGGVGPAQARGGAQHALMPARRAACRARARSMRASRWRRGSARGSSARRSPVSPSVATACSLSSSDRVERAGPRRCARRAAAPTSSWAAVRPRVRRERADHAFTHQRGAGQLKVSCICATSTVRSTRLPDKAAAAEPAKRSRAAQRLPLRLPGALLPRSCSWGIAAEHGWPPDPAPWPAQASTATAPTGLRLWGIVEEPPRPCRVPFDPPRPPRSGRAATMSRATLPMAPSAMPERAGQPGRADAHRVPGQGGRGQAELLGQTPRRRRAPVARARPGSRPPPRTERPARGRGPRQARRRPRRARSASSPL